MNAKFEDATGHNRDPKLPPLNPLPRLYGLLKVLSVPMAIFDCMTDEWCNSLGASEGPLHANGCCCRSLNAKCMGAGLFAGNAESGRKDMLKDDISPAISMLLYWAWLSRRCRRLLGLFGGSTAAMLEVVNAECYRDLNIC